MKTYLTYGLAISFALAVLSLISHILGLSTSAERLGTAMIIGIAGLLVILTTGIVLGTKAARSSVPPNEGFTYGRAFTSGVLIALFAAAGGAVFNAVYFAYIHPDHAEITVQWTTSLMEKMGAPESEIERTVQDIRAKSGVVRQVLNGAVFTVILGAVISLVTSAFLKRPATEEIPALP